MKIRFGTTYLTGDDLRSLLLQSPSLPRDLIINDIKGPFEGKINTIFQISTSNFGDILIRCRTSKAFRYEGFVKEKILYPLLERKLNPFSADCFNNVKSIVGKTHGFYIFQNPPIVPVQELLFWDETLEKLPYPYAIKSMIPGKTLYEVMNESSEAQLNSRIFTDVFEQAGRLLGCLHKIRFQTFYDTIDQIGSPNGLTWETLYWRQCLKELGEARHHKELHSFIGKVEKILSDGRELMKNEEPVLFHNDFQAQNLIVQGNGQTGYEITGVIDFDNWRIGPPIQDFVKIIFWTIKNRPSLLDAFLNGYAQVKKIHESYKEILRIYQLLWFLLVFNFEVDKIKNAEQNAVVDARFPAAQQYLQAITSLVSEFTK